jgi:hypothetical protein
MNDVHDVSDGTVGWFVFGTGTVRITEKDTLRLSVVNTVLPALLSSAVFGKTLAWSRILMLSNLTKASIAM